MTTWIILLRGINVGGHNILPMADLRTALTSDGLQDVATYIQSGNIVLTSTTSDAKKMASKTAQIIEQGFGMELDVRAIPAKVFQTIIEDNPFPEATSDPKTLHLSFLAQTPNVSKLTTLEALVENGERLALHGKIVYLHAPNGIGRSKLAHRMEAILGVPSTSRNWRTVLKLLELVSEQP